MDSKIRQERQREFTIYLVLFILLVIVGAVGYNRTPTYPNYYYSMPAGPYGYMYGGLPMYGGHLVHGGPFGPGYGYPGPTYYGGPPMGGVAPFSGGPTPRGWW